MSLALDEGYTGTIQEDKAPFRFLVAAEVPVQRGTVRKGDRVRVLVNRPVLRVGYRLVPRDFRKEAVDLWGKPEVRSAVFDLCKALGLSPHALSMEGPRSRMREAVCVALAQKARFGGSERGVLVNVWDETPLREVVTVWATRRHQLGDHYPASGWGENAEPGGLDGRRTITVCSTDIGDFLSGDLEVVPDEDVAR